MSLSECKWLDPLYTADQMRAADSWAIEKQGIPSLDLMEKAGAEVARFVTEIYPSGEICIVCGKGNNGGDGLVCARMLSKQGHKVKVLLLAPETELSGDSKENLNRLRESDCEIEVAEGKKDLSSALTNAQVVVDAIFGTGFSGEPRGLPAVAIDLINGCDALVVAVDIPSGVDSTTGEAAGPAVKASSTVTFHIYKVGHFVNPGKSFSGSVEVVDIGIPPVSEGNMPQIEPNSGLIGPDVTGLYPERSRKSTKFSVGSVAVIGGSTGLTGAVCMASEAAMRVGAGYVRAVVPRSLNSVFEQKLTEVMTVPVADHEGAFTADAVAGALDTVQHSDAVVLGPGLGRYEESLEAARSIARNTDRPLVIDADGLYALAGHLDLLESKEGDCVLTPHAGELARLVGVASSEVEARRLSLTRELALETGATVVLKGDDTIVAKPDGQTAISRGATPGLATAGSGDLLSGVIGALLAKQIGAFEAACLGVYLHSGAGIAAADQVGESGMIATDVIEMLPKQLR